jgi:hypothetical protein
MATREELEQIAQDVTIDEGSRQKAVALLNATETKDTGSEYQLAEWYRTFQEPQRSQAFESARRMLKHVAFSLENEARAADPRYVAVFGTKGNL